MFSYTPLAKDLVVSKKELYFWDFKRVALCKLGEHLVQNYDKMLEIAFPRPKNSKISKIQKSHLASTPSISKIMDPLPDMYCSYSC